ncbi:Uncharacterised protein [Morganella morganii]|nr:Uncharacterised protein [Morganella morganii]
MLNFSAIDFFTDKPPGSIILKFRDRIRIFGTDKLHPVIILVPRGGFQFTACAVIKPDILPDNQPFRRVRPADFMLIRVTGGCAATEPVITVLNLPSGKIGLADNLPGIVPLIAVLIPCRINHFFQPRQAVIFKADFCTVRTDHRQQQVKRTVTVTGYFALTVSDRHHPAFTVIINMLMYAVRQENITDTAVNPRMRRIIVITGGIIQCIREMGKASQFIKLILRAVKIRIDTSAQLMRRRIFIPPLRPVR